LNASSISFLAQGARAPPPPPPPPDFFKGLKVPFLVMKSALFVQANVAVNTKLQCFFKKIGKKRAISVWYEGKFVFQLPRCHNFREKIF
jgi:hypothetical protein